MIKFTDYTLNINDNVILDNISFSVENNSLISICGESGSGKTTLLNLIAGIKPSANISENGEIENPQKKSIHYITVDDNVVGILSVLDNLKLCSSNKENINEILEELELTEIKNTKCSLLSKGERERVAIAMGLLDSKEILLIDEPTANLDVKSSELVFSLLRKYSSSKIIIVATHDVGLAKKYSNRILEIDSEKHLKETTIATEVENSSSSSSKRFHFPFLQYFKISFKQLLSDTVGLILSSLLLTVSLLISFVGLSFAFIDNKATFTKLINEENGSFIVTRDKNYDNKEKGYKEYITEYYPDNKEQIIPLFGLNDENDNVFASFNTYINDETINNKITLFKNSHSTKYSYPIYLSETYIQESNSTFSIGDKVDYTYETYNNIEFIYDGSFNNIENDLVEAIIPEDVRLEKYEDHFSTNDFKYNLNVYDIRKPINALGNNTLMNLADHMELGTVIKPFTNSVTLKYGEKTTLERNEVVISNENMYNLLFSHPEIENIVKDYRNKISFTSRDYYLTNTIDNIKIVGCTEKDDVIYINESLYKEITNRVKENNYEEYDLSINKEYVTKNIDKVFTAEWNINNSYYYDLYISNNYQARTIMIISIFVFCLTIGACIFHFNNILKRNSKNYVLLSLIGKTKKESISINIIASCLLSIIPLIISYSAGITCVYSIKKLFNKLLMNDFYLAFVNNIQFGFILAFILVFVFVVLLTLIITLSSLIRKKNTLK